MYMYLTRLFKYIAWAILLWMLVESCEVSNPAVTPTADLTFQVRSQSNEPINAARVYLFATESAYLAYLQDNPDADPLITPSLTPDRVGNTNDDGMTMFFDYELDGPFYSSGATHFYNPNPIYIRVEGSANGTDILTNDNDITKLTFEELESGDKIIEMTDIFLN